MFSLPPPISEAMQLALYSFGDEPPQSSTARSPRCFLFCWFRV